ncbi:MAG: kynureninase [Proteobacteria bacterium]|nr:kynureninase [Pseudomonadota bacterium]
MTDRAAWQRLDADDPLRAFRERFELPDGVIYLDGNSLGALPRATPGRVAALLHEAWGRDLITSWNKHGWIDLPTRVGDKIARLIGAAPSEVAVADSTSVNLFKLLSGALDLAPGRRVVLSDRGNFPTDLYIAQGLVGLRGGGLALEVVDEARVAAAIDATTAVVMLTHVNYRSGRMHDLAALTAAAHRAGALMLWDLSHSAGAMPIDLNAAGADFAVGCGYKYLNGGPGAPAFLFIAARHQAGIRPPLSGWMGHVAPFAFDHDYRPAAGIARNLCGTPAILSLVALESGVDLMLEADLAAVRAKSRALGERFWARVTERCPGRFALASPADPAARGSQLCLSHPEGYAIVQALIARGVIPDFRAPDILRFGFAPLYTRYVDIWDAVEQLADIMATRAWDAPQFHTRAKVT